MKTASRELFELCKQVYEATGWKYTVGTFHDDGSYDGYVGHRGIAYTPNPQNAEWLPKNIPLYTSDYLLEKLPNYIYLQQSADGKSWRASQLQPTELRTAENAYQSINTSADTPLLALLRLTLKLHEEKML